MYAEHAMLTTHQHGISAESEPVHVCHYANIATTSKRLPAGHEGEQHAGTDLDAHTASGTRLGKAGDERSTEAAERSAVHAACHACPPEHLQLPLVPHHPLPPARHAAHPAEGAAMHRVQLLKDSAHVEGGPLELASAELATVGPGMYQQGTPPGSGLVCQSSDQHEASRCTTLRAQQEGEASQVDCQPASDERLGTPSQWGGHVPSAPLAGADIAEACSAGLPGAKVQRPAADDSASEAQVVHTQPCATPHSTLHSVTLQASHAHEQDPELAALLRQVAERRAIVAAKEAAAQRRALAAQLARLQAREAELDTAALEAASPPPPPPPPAEPEQHLEQEQQRTWQQLHTDAGAASAAQVRSPEGTRRASPEHCPVPSDAGSADVHAVQEGTHPPASREQHSTPADSVGTGSSEVQRWPCSQAGSASAAVSASAGSSPTADVSSAAPSSKLPAQPATGLLTPDVSSAVSSLVDSIAATPEHSAQHAQVAHAAVREQSACSVSTLTGTVTTSEHTGVHADSVPHAHTNMLSRVSSHGAPFQSSSDSSGCGGALDDEQVERAGSAAAETVAQSIASDDVHESPQHAVRVHEHHLSDDAPESRHGTSLWQGQDTESASEVADSPQHKESNCSSEGAHAAAHQQADVLTSSSSAASTDSASDQARPVRSRSGSVELYVDVHSEAAFPVGAAAHHHTDKASSTYAASPEPLDFTIAADCAPVLAPAQDRAAVVASISGYPHRSTACQDAVGDAQLSASQAGNTASEVLDMLSLGATAKQYPMQEDSENAARSASNAGPSASSHLAGTASMTAPTDSGSQAQQWASEQHGVDALVERTAEALLRCASSLYCSSCVC